MSAIPFKIVFQKDKENSQAQTTVVLTCYNYGKEAIEALYSVKDQTEVSIDIVIVDDCSTDRSVEIILNWLNENAAIHKFNNIFFLQHTKNQGLSISRNTALSIVKTPYVFILDADNMIYPRCLTELRQALEVSDAAMTYSLIEQFGAERSIVGNSLWIPEKFRYGNYIDAMALIKTAVLRDVGGYRKMPYNFGFEDFDLWCTFVDRNLKSCHVPQILCRYRVHDKSMLRSKTQSLFRQHRKEILDDLEAHHSFKFYMF